MIDMITQEQFNKRSKQFEILEKRGGFYEMALEMIEKGMMPAAFVLILSTWNFATFRYVVKTFAVNDFVKLVNGMAKDFRKFEKQDFKKIDFEKHRDEIYSLFNKLYRIKGVRSTGTTKLLHLAAPRTFVIWDKQIREHYGFKKGDAKDYVDFLRLMQEKFGHLKSPSKHRTLAKSIDEYNYITITMPFLKKKKYK